MIIEELRRFCSDENMFMTRHTVNRCFERGIKYGQIKQAILNGEIIEQYPADHPYPSCLILNISTENQPLHIVAGAGEGKLWIITAYYPSPVKWEDDGKTRKAEKS